MVGRRVLTDDALAHTADDTTRYQNVLHLDSGNAEVRMRGESIGGKRIC
jgi:hypothetical protein